MREESLKDWLPLKGRWLGYFQKAVGCAAGIVAGWCVFSVACGPRYWVTTKKGQVATAKTQISCFKSGLDLYVLDNGRVPTTLQGLDALLNRPTQPPLAPKWRGPYLKDTVQVPLDPWGHPYLYQTVRGDAKACVVVSYGEDGRAGGSGYAADLSGGFRPTGDAE